MFLPTLRDTPADAKVISHQLMLRAGYIRKLASGIYTFLPLGIRVIKKISRIIREEMDRAHGQEILMPMVQPAELWQESGRFDEYGPELLRFKDRKDSWFCLGPTHEEVVTALVRDHVKSYKQLPITLYQIQTKFRDEIRPRFGLMRGREFLMKDAYSFGADKASQDQAYQGMWDAYHRIFERCGLRFRAVRADTGAIGGDLSHEFQVLAQSGEDAIASCHGCDYAANVELAEVKREKPAARPSNDSAAHKVDLPDLITVSEQAEYLGIGEDMIIKSLAYEIDGTLALILLRGHQQLSEAKLKSSLGANSIRMMDEDKAEKKIGPRGFIGPLALKEHLRVIADNSLKGGLELVAGANEKNTHFAGIDVDRDIDAEFFDIAQAQAGDLCKQCGTTLEILRGIEVGHIFYLGKKYSKALKAEVQDDKGEMVAMEMGCYGIGVGRTAAAAIEQNHDDKGMIWPASIAPFQVHLVQLGDGEDMRVAVQGVYDRLIKAGIEVLLDDRDERAGVKLNDADLIGCPVRLTLGARGLKSGQLEALPRGAQENGPSLLNLDSDYDQRLKEILSLL